MSKQSYVLRRKSVLIEKFINHTISLNNTVSHLNNIPLFFNMEYLRKNKFIVEMKIDDKIVNAESIQGFKISNFENGEKSIKVHTAIHLDTWLNDYNKVNIIKIYLLDSIGSELREFDLDVIYLGYSFDCDYKEDALAIPTFTYKIIE